MPLKIEYRYHSWSSRCKGNSAMEWRAQVQSYVSKRTELPMQLLHSCWTALSFEEQLTWRKLHMNWLLISLSVTTNADAFLHKGNVWAHDQLSLYVATNIPKRATHASALSFPKPKFVIELTNYASLYTDVECKLFFIN